MKKPIVRIDAPYYFMPEKVKKMVDDSFDHHSTDFEYCITNPGNSHKYLGTPWLNLKAWITPSTGKTHITDDGTPIHCLSDDPEYVKTITASAEYTLGMIISCVRKMDIAYKYLDDWRGAENDMRGEELSEKSLGIIGYGRIGEKLERYARELFGSVHAYDTQSYLSGPQVREFDTILKCDVVCLCINYTPENHHFVDAGMFAKMRKGSYFINTSRGECVDQHALIDALESGHIKRAACDVIEGEQSGDIKNVPLFKYAKAHPDKIFLSPHIAGATIQSQEKAMIWAINKIKELENEI